MKSFKKQFHLASLVFNLIGSASFYPYSQFLPKGEWRNGGSARAAWANLPSTIQPLGALYTYFYRGLSIVYKGPSMEIDAYSAP